jgi:hypothetical protein
MSFILFNDKTAINLQPETFTNLKKITAILK